jgi:hypothetical protein
VQDRGLAVLDPLRRRGDRDDQADAHRQPERDEDGLPQAPAQLAPEIREEHATSPAQCPGRRARSASTWVWQAVITDERLAEGRSLIVVRRPRRVMGEGTFTPCVLRHEVSWFRAFMTAAGVEAAALAWLVLALLPLPLPEEPPQAASVSARSMARPAAANGP